MSVFDDEWCCCCRQKDLETFLDHTRSKFVGFNVKNDNGSLAGLPLPIHEGVKVLNQVTTYCLFVWQSFFYFI